MSERIGMVFPGQGSQSVGMLVDAANAFPIILSLYNEASDILGYDIWKLVSEGPADKLNQTEFTQPALLIADVALYRCWQEQNLPAPVVFAGHSLGEYAALVCADSLTFSDAVRLVENRGRYMQAAVKEGEGAMAAIIGLDNDTINSLCEEAAEGELVSPANYNSLGQTVVAGNAAAVDRLLALAKPAGAKIAKRIPVSVPSHCDLMRPAAAELEKDLANVDIAAPHIPVLHNVNVESHQGAIEIRHALVEQLVSPVRWVETIERFAADGVEEIVECGPGKVLTGLNKRINKNIATNPIMNRMKNYHE